MAEGASTNPFARFAYIDSRDENDELSTGVGLEAAVKTAQEEKKDSKRNASVAEGEKKKRKKKKTEASLMGAGDRCGKGTIGNETDAQILIERWQTMADGANDVQLRRFIVLVGVMLSSQTVSTVASRGVKALREAARAEGEDDLTASWLLTCSESKIADIIKMINFRNNKAKALLEVAAAVKKNCGRVATTSMGYKEYRGIGKELSSLLLLVNEPILAKTWCQGTLPSRPGDDDSASLVCVKEEEEERPE